jgi:hypothetical protein
MSDRYRSTKPDDDWKILLQIFAILLGLAGIAVALSQIAPVP